MPRFPGLRVPHAAMLLLGAAALTACAPYRGTEQEVTFRSSDGTELHGSLVMPREAAEPVPAVVLLHGAEAATRSMVYRMHANLFLERGYAVLLYDKRGAGASGGSREATTFALLADDALAAIEFVRRQRGIDAGRIGLVTASQSGWFAPEVAERAGGLAFMINKVGPCTTWRETVTWEVFNDLMADGVPEASAREQAEIRGRIWRNAIAPTPEETEALATLLAEWAGREDSQLPATLPDFSADALADIGYDPAPYLERLQTPALYLYGEDDINVPSARCAERLGELQARGLPVSWHVFPDAGHELGGVGIRGYQFTSGYADLLTRFADAHVPGR